MIKKVLLICLMSLSSYTFAQPHRFSTEQKTFLMNSQDKEKAQEFQEKVKIKIDKHRTQMRARKEVLEREKEELKAEIRNAKAINNGKLSPEQRSDFKSKIEIIENKSLELRKENYEFISQIDKEREEFFSSIKNKKLN